MSNNYKVLLVHGFLGWGNNEFLGYNYWGGSRCLSDMLKEIGYSVFTPSIGPASSNWDRACELYAYIVGGRVDYGLAHSRKYNHNRYGITYKGLGEKFNENNKLHLIGHSMGGQTIRLLAYLLENGSDEEKATSGQDTNLLFLGGNNFIQSITTICTPHDGSIVDDVSGNFKSYIYSIVSHIPEDKRRAFIKRIAELGLYRDFNLEGYKDTAMWDLCSQGAEELNEVVKNSKDIYYYTVSCEAFNGLGHDGLVNISSAMGPHKGTSDVITNYNQISKIGVYNYIGNLRNTNHAEIIFWGDDSKKEFYIGFYKSIIEMLLKL